MVRGSCRGRGDLHDFRAGKPRRLPVHLSRRRREGPAPGIGCGPFLSPHQNDILKCGVFDENSATVGIPSDRDIRDEVLAQGCRRGGSVGKHPLQLSIRSVLVAGAITLLVVTAAVIGGSAYLSSERALERMARDLTANAAGWTMEQVENTLGPSGEARQVSQRLADPKMFAEANIAAIEEAFFDALGLYPSLGAVSYGGRDGDFIYVGRNETLSPGGIDRKSTR